MSELMDLDTETIVAEQQADCFAGVYLRSVAAGESGRFTLSTGDGLNRVLAGAIYIRDPPQAGSPDDAHGNALDRISAFQMGFSGGADQCAAIDRAEIERRRGDLPEYLTGYFSETQVLDSPIDQDMLSNLMEVLTEIFQPDRSPNAHHRNERMRRRTIRSADGILFGNQHHLRGPCCPAGGGGAEDRERR